MASPKRLNPSASEYVSQTLRLAPPPMNSSPSFHYYYLSTFQQTLPSPAWFLYSPITYSVPTTNQGFETPHVEVEQQQTHEAAPKNNMSNRCSSFYYYKPSETTSSTTSLNTLKNYEWKVVANNKKKSVDDFYLMKMNSKKKRPYSDVLPVMKDGAGTTVMIRNIPNKYTRDLLVAFLDRHCAEANQKLNGEEDSSAFDFLYLPIDFWTGLNKGYAFVNFSNPKAVWKFYLAAHSQKWESFNSNKIREIAYARIQGKEDLVDHFETMVFPCKSENVLPVCYSPERDGSEVAVETRPLGKVKGWDRRSHNKDNKS